MHANIILNCWFVHSLFILIDTLIEIRFSMRLYTINRFNCIEPLSATTSKKPEIRKRHSLRDGLGMVTETPDVLINLANIAAKQWAH